MSKFETTTVPFHSNVTHKRRAKNPSFSSILLDTIYRSIDEDDYLHDYPRTTPTSPTRTIIKQCDDSEKEPSKQRRNKMRSDSTLETVDLRRAIMIESWMERQQQPQQPPHRKHFHLGDVLDQKISVIRQKSVPSRSRASDNNSTTDFSSSSSSCFTNLASREQSSSRIFTKTKSRAMKIYGELRRPKQHSTTTTTTTPVSPGRRIAAFLNSIFRNTGGSPPRSSPPEIKLNPPPAAMTTTNSTCSSASSFSRSCLSTKTSSSNKSSSTPGTKRSVRFYPVSVIVDEDSRPCGHKSLHNKNECQESEKLVSPPTGYGGGTVERQRRWRREKEIDALMRMIKTNCGNIQQRHGSSFDDEMEEEEDDGGSCASSDLFELENFSSIGVSRYYEELPVYGTTSLKNLTA